MPRLTEKLISAARAGDGEVFLWDNQLAGFACRIKPSGVKTLMVQYRAGHRTRRVKVGRWPVMRVEKARREAHRLLAEIGDGGDPSERKRQERAIKSDTFEAIAADFVARHCKAKGRRSWKETERIFRVYVNPVLGRSPIREVTRRSIIDLLDHIAENNGPIMANRVLAAVRKMFNWAIGRDIIDASCVVGIERPGEETKRQRVLTDPEIREVWVTAEALGSPYGPLVKLLLLTGQRRGEVGGMLRSEIDEQEKLWTIPAERVKNGLPHEVPLSAAALGIIGSLPANGECVFSTGKRGDRPANSFTLAKRRIDAAILAARKTAGVKAEAMPSWTFHDLRRTTRTRLSMIGISPEIAERVIGHVPAGVRAVYDTHQFRDEKRAALELWARVLGSLINPNDKIVILARGRSKGGDKTQTAPSRSTGLTPRHEARRADPSCRVRW